MAKKKAPTAPSYERLAEKLISAASGSAFRREVALTALSTAMIMQGMPEPFYGASLRHLVDHDDRHSTFHQLWETEAASMPYLRGNIDPLLRWIDKAVEADLEALDKCFEVLTGIDLPQCIRDCGGDLLGPVYTATLGASERKNGGKFYTPMSVSRMIAAMNQTQEGQSVMDPCCGSGGMILAVVLDMRDRGLRAETCTFTLVDIDPIAVALAGVNMASRGIPFVSLTCGDSLDPGLVLSPPATGAEMPRPRAVA